MEQALTHPYRVIAPRTPSAEQTIGPEGLVYDATAGEAVSARLLITCALGVAMGLMFGLAF